MSRSCVTKGYISLKGFAHLPKIGDSVPGEPQPRSSLDSGSVSSRFSGISSRRAAQLEEGDLITGTIDITHERAYMLPAIRDEDHTEEVKALVCTYFSLANTLNLTHSLPPGGVYHLLENHTASLSGRLDIG